jgi:long-chain acyl-CoA synthetase
MSTLLTGATGFLGTWICHWLIENTRENLVLPVRAEKGMIESRLRRAWWDWPGLRAEIGQRIRPVPGDITKKDLGLSESDLVQVREEVSRIIHSAAVVWFDRTAEEMETVNVIGTGNVIQLARSIDSVGGLERLSHISTAYVAGRREGVIGEDDLDDAEGFHNEYERTKFAAERMLLESGIPLSVFRPGMIVGDTETGWVRTFNTLYIPLRLYVTGRMRALPVRKDMRVNMVPVDHVADAVGRMTLDRRGEGKTFHLTPSWEAMPTVDSLVERTREWCMKNLSISLPSPIMVPLPSSLMRRSLGRYAPLIPYLRERRRFLRENSERLIGEYDVDWRELLDRMLEFASNHGFMHRSDRTVHQQMMFKMGSRSRPVRYRDQGDDVVEWQGERIKERASRATSALGCIISPVKGWGWWDPTALDTLSWTLRSGSVVASVSPSTTRHHPRRS